jgi:hypothetical protein
MKTTATSRTKTTKLVTNNSRASRPKAPVNNSIAKPPPDS